MEKEKMIKKKEDISQRRQKNSRKRLTVIDRNNPRIGGVYR
jgi:hypothetical protein